ncbi:MAG: hypothetical protein WBE72_10295 [Terracidiphilus sp.]
MAQWSLVGDCLMALREQAADPPSALPAPVLSAVNPSPTGSTNFWFTATQLTPWGESPASVEIAVTTGAINSVFTATGTCSFAATAIRIYFTLGGAGQEDRYSEYAIPSGGQGTFSLTFTLSSTGTGQGAITPGFAPTRSSAWLPDTDGTALSAAALFRWINEGLDATTALTEGIRDVTGIPSTAGQAQYQVVSNWRKLTSGFYDGYPITMGSKSDIFRHSNVTGISGTTVLNQDSVVQQVELYPQSSRTSGNGVLNGNLSASATSIPYTPGSSGWVLGFGLALIGVYPGDPSGAELIYYSGNASNSLSPVTRGMGGTIAQAWPNGTPVSEANIYFSGIRYPLHYSKGQSANQLNLPPAWIDALRDYLSARFKQAEQDVEGAGAVLKMFEQKCLAIKGNREVMSPRQVQVGGQNGPEVAIGLGGFFGGVIIP